MAALTAQEQRFAEHLLAEVRKVVREELEAALAEKAGAKPEGDAERALDERNARGSRGGPSRKESTE